MEKDKKYYKPEYANKSDNELQREITKNFDEIQYIMRKMLDVTLLKRKDLEEFHSLIRTLWYTCYDLQNL